MVSMQSRVRFTELLLSALVLLLSGLLIFHCLTIYQIGTAPSNLGADGVHLADVYTREDVTARLAQISWSFFLLLSVLACAVVLRQIHPLSPVKPQLSPEMQLEAMLLHRDKTDAVRTEERKRRLYTAVCGVVCAACAFMAARYLLKPTTFASTDLETVMADVVRHTLPLLQTAFAALALLAQARHASTLRALAAIKKAPSHAAAAQAPSAERFTACLRAVLYAAAVLLIAAGILNGGRYDVLVKAVNICTECIGLG